MSEPRTEAGKVLLRGAAPCDRTTILLIEDEASQRQEALLAGIESIKRKSDPGVDLAGFRPPTDERGERLNSIFLIARALLDAPQPADNKQDGKTDSARD